MSVKTSLLWGAGAWNLTVRQERRLATTQRKMIRSMLRIPRSADEGADEHMARVNHTVTYTIAKYSVQDWVTAWRKSQFQWGGKVVQQGLHDIDRITKKVMDWKDIRTLHSFAQKNKGWQGHPRRFHAWRCKTNLYNYFSENGLHWKKIAADPIAYREHLEKYILWRDRPRAERSGR